MEDFLLWEMEGGKGNVKAAGEDWDSLDDDAKVRNMAISMSGDLAEGWKILEKPATPEKQESGPYEAVDFDRLAYQIVTDFESEREESGRREIERGMRHLLGRFKTPEERKIISETLISLTGFSLDSIVENSRHISEDELEYGGLF